MTGEQEMSQPEGDLALDDNPEPARKISSTSFRDEWHPTHFPPA
jgi:hypothetical protein